jgi:hypothetical protein
MQATLEKRRKVIAKSPGSDLKKNKKSKEGGALRLRNKKQ